MSDDTKLLEEIRDQLREQTRLIADLKAQNEVAMKRNAEHMAKAEEMAHSSLAQNTKALQSTGWLKWGFWVFLAFLLLIFAVPILWGFFQAAP